MAPRRQSSSEGTEVDRHQGWQKLIAAKAKLTQIAAEREKMRMTVQTDLVKRVAVLHSRISARRDEARRAETEEERQQMQLLIKACEERDRLQQFIVDEIEAMRTTALDCAEKIGQAFESRTRDLEAASPNRLTEDKARGEAA